MSLDSLDDVVVDAVEHHDEPAESSEAKPAPRYRAKSQAQAAGNDTIPTIDRHGNPRHIPTRQCYCPEDAATDCRFHSPSEPGWQTCPYSPGRKVGGKLVPTQLFGLNPDFGHAKKEAAAV